MRAVSLLPSATEIVCALGRRPILVGRSEECDYPEEVRDLPVVMRARTLDASRPSGEIDSRVQTARSSDQSLYDLDIPLLARLSPDVVLTQDLCRVCSVTDSEVLEACRSARVEPRIVSVTPRRLAEVWDSIETIGAAIGAGPAASALAGRLRGASEAPGLAGLPRIAVLEWVDPPILAGLWGPDMIRASGGVPVRGEPGEPGIRLRWPDVRGLAPDLVVISPCSFGVPRTRSEVAGTPEAVRELSRLRPRLGVWLADEAYFSRPGPRLIDGVRLLRDLVSGRPPEAPMAIEPWQPMEIAR
jgi:iron complex transport system substrate-binding protein